MNTKKLIERFSENLGPKIICLSLAVLCYVFNRFSSLEHRTFTVPLIVEQDSLFLPVTELPKYVRITVRTTPENIPAITSSSFKASVSFDRFTEGGHVVVPVTVTTAENLMLMETLEYSVKPESFAVELDESLLRYVPVKASVSGEVERGYEISKIDIAPSTVKVTGPSEIVSTLKYIDTRKVNVNGASISFSQDVKLDNRFSKINVMPEGDFKVTVVISPSQGTRDFSNLEIMFQNLNENLEVSGKLPLVNIKIAGSVPVLESYKPNERTVFVNLSSFTEPGTYDVPVEFFVPSNLTVSEQSVKNISITLTEKIIEDENEESVQEEESAL